MGLGNFERTQIQNLVSFIIEDNSLHDLDSTSIDERYHQYERDLIQNYRDFAKNVKNINWGELSALDTDNVLSQFDFKLSDTINKLNKLHFEMGMKAGANIIKQLI